MFEFSQDVVHLILLLFWRRAPDSGAKGRSEKPARFAQGTPPDTQRESPSLRPEWPKAARYAQRWGRNPTDDVRPFPAILPGGRNFVVAISSSANLSSINGA